jgi:hypothetical protein
MDLKCLEKLFVTIFRTYGKGLIYLGTVKVLTKICYNWDKNLAAIIFEKS